MRYLHHAQAGQSQLKLEGNDHRYIFKVRRHKVDDTLCLRNLEDSVLYEYMIMHIDKTSVHLELQKRSILEIRAKQLLHIGWCVIDSKNIEKVLPTLNEMGVEKITFIYCKRSQKSFKPDFQRLHKILLNSSQQSGRSQMMKLEIAESLQQFLAEYPQSKMLNFSKNHFFASTKNVESIVIGCEGGFHEEEVSLFNEENIVGFDTALVLKSESAVCAVAAKMLL